jgi:adenylate kinase family enzyme
VAERILLYGVTGSGKSTLAARLAERTGIPWHPVDELTWRPGWLAVPDEEQRQKVTEICETERWILDTAYTGWLDVALGRADLIVCLDYPRVVSLTWLVRRSVARAADKRPICNGNTESFRQLFSRNSIVLWHFRSFSTKRRRMRNWAADPGKRQVVLFRSPSATRNWLAHVEVPARS